MSRAELIDIYDESGHIIGTATRDAAHRDGLLHRSANIWILNARSELLLQKRGAAKQVEPGKLDTSVSGHIRAGETSVDAAVREAAEELGIRIDPADLIPLFQCRFFAKITPEIVENEINDVYLYRTTLEIADCTCPDGEVDALKYIYFTDLERAWHERSPELIPYHDQFPQLFSHLHRLLDSPDAG